MASKLSNNQVHDRLHAAAEMLDGEAETVEGATALEAARRALMLFMLGLLKSEENKSTKDPEAP